MLRLSILYVFPLLLPACVHKEPSARQATAEPQDPARQEAAVTPSSSAKRPGPARLCAHAIGCAWGFRDRLAKLAVVESATQSFDKSVWNQWVDEDEDCQDTRQEVLIRDSWGTVTFKTENKCEVLSGQWHGAYTGEIVTDPRLLVVSNLVPLAHAHRLGGSSWDEGLRRRYANDLSLRHLRVFKASNHRERRDRGPEHWLPEVEDRNCRYISDWIDVKVRWRIGMSADEKETLETLISSQCSH